ncbi:hypothetical protein LCGC14_1688970 [marine sediment metagenome]|uniref:Uncharacterized protein n=1 Tax=marine sediment metagenome TaxID=412755 RepID=A0A0F9K1Z6_9ZZZZ
MLFISISEEINNSEERVRDDKEFNTKIIRLITKRMVIRNFNLVGEFSFFRAMKNKMVRTVRKRITTM